MMHIEQKSEMKGGRDERKEFHRRRSGDDEQWRSEEREHVEIKAGGIKHIQVAAIKERT